MWIKEIFIESFGAAQQLRIPDLGPGLTVIVGHNEAGKTTVLEFVRSVFFGFKKKSGKFNIYEPPDGTSRSGWVTVNSGNGGLFRVHRGEKRGLREGGLTVFDDSGNRVPQGSLPLPSASLDRKAYENLFAFDLDGMRRLDREALRGKILAAALGSVAVNPLEVISSVNARLKKIAKCPERDGESLWSLQNRLKKLDKQIREISDTPERHALLTSQLKVGETRREEIAKRIRSQEATLNELNRLIRYEEEWTRLVEIEREISPLEEARHFPVDGVSRLERALERRSEARQAILETEQSLDHLHRRLAGLQPDTQIVEQAEELHVLAREASRLTDYSTQIERARAALLTSEALLEEEIAGLGKDWDTVRVQSFEPSLILEQEIRSFADCQRAAHEEIHHARARQEESAARCRTLKAKIARVKYDISQLAPLCKGYLPREFQRLLDQWKSNRHRMSDLKDNFSEKGRRLSRMSAVRQQLEESMERVGNESFRFVSPVLFWLVIILIGAAAVGMCILGWKNSDVVSYLFLISGLGLLLCIPFGIHWRSDWERWYRDKIRREIKSLNSRIGSATNEMAQTENSRRAIRVRIKELQRESQRIAEKVLGKRDAGRGDVLKAESLSHKAEEPMQRARSLQTELRTVTEDLKIEEDRIADLSQRIDEAQSESARVRESWVCFAMDRGLSGDVTPEIALGLVVRLRDIKRNLRKFTKERDDLATMEQEWDAFKHRVHALGQLIGHPVNTDQSLMDQVDLWVRSEVESREILSEQESLMDRIRDREVMVEAQQSKVAEMQGMIANLLNDAAVIDEEAFREHSRQHDRLQVLEHEHAALLSTLLSGLGLTDAEEIRSLMTEQDWPANHDAAMALQASLDDLRAQSEQLANLSGKLCNEIEFLESEDQTERLLAEKHESIAVLNRLGNEWKTLKLASLLLARTLRIHETERQPKVLAKGSKIFRDITGNSFKRILLPLDEDQVMAERSNLARVREHHLSRGTLEQVYLALKLAHLEVLGSGEPIPVLMDDILVNFDPARARRTAHALANFSYRSNTQVLFFTCHQHTANLFPETVVRKDLEPVPVNRAPHAVEPRHHQ
jgi:uncharacterized protein YhaN/uncharacterized protein YukE